MHATEQNGLIELSFQYKASIVNDIKTIPGRRWNPTKKLWTVPVSERAKVDRLMAKYGTPKAAQKPELVGDIPPMPELTIDIPLKMTPFPYQKTGIACSLNFKRLIVGDQPGLGKAQPLDSRLATPNGWKKMGDIEIGDTVYTRNGSPTVVDGIFPQGLRDKYRITFNDGSETYCDLEHLWVVRDHNARRRESGWKILTTYQLINKGLNHPISPSRISSGRKPLLKWEIPLCDPVSLPKKNQIIPAYIAGVLIGDGALTGDSICFSTPDKDIEIVTKVSQLLPSYLKLLSNRHPDCPQYFITQTGTTNKNPYLLQIKDMGLNVKSGNKFIPETYLFGSIEQRTELLRGLMDTDGSCRKNRSIFHTTSLELAENVKELTQSLGGIANVRKYDRRSEGKPIEYQVNINTYFCPFSLPRKANEWKPSKRARFIERIEICGKAEMQCIRVTADDHTYLTDQYIVTHNTGQAIATITGANAFPCLVICPSSLKINWQREWTMWAGKKAMILNDRNRDTWHLFANPKNNLFGVSAMVDVFITNYESLKKYFVASIINNGGPLRLDQIRFKENINIIKSVIIDESHRVKDASTQQSKFVKGVASGKEYILALTGTPVVNKPRDLVSQLAIIDQLKVFGGYKHFVDRYCQEGGTNLKELNFLLRKNCFYRREKTEVLKDLPAKMRQIAYCDITTRKEYRDALADLEKYLKLYRQATDEQVARSMKGEVMVRIGVLKNISARGKINDVVDYVKDVIESGEKIVVFVHLKEVAQMLLKFFPSAVTILGDDDMQTRQRNIDSFQKDPDTQIIICSIKAAGVGITLTASSRVAFVEQPWHPADSEQCEDRCHRIGQKDSVQCIYFLGKDTIDEWIYKVIEEKRSIANTIVGAVDEVETSIMESVMNLFNQR